MQAFGLLHFLRELSTRYQKCRWSNVVQVPEVMPEIIGQPTINLLAGYDRLSMMQVRDHIASYIANPVRIAQDSMQLYICLNVTLTKEALDMISAFDAEYTVNGIHRIVQSLLKRFTET